MSVESNEEAEQVTEGHNKFKELIEGKNLQKMEEKNRKNFQWCPLSLLGEGPPKKQD